MTTPFIGEIQLFGFNFNPSGWAFCNGATLPIQQNTPLFSLIGITYGGDGSKTFQLPNFIARSMCQQGQSPGNTLRPIGSTFGAAEVTLDVGQLPIHNHGLVYFSQSDATKRSATPRNGDALSVPTLPEATPFATAQSPLNAQFAPTMVQPVGNGEAHPNQQPYLAVNFCIALSGAFPGFN